MGFHGKLIDGDLARMLRIPLAPGLLIEVIAPGNPAEKAGSRGGTLDLSIGGRELLVGGDIATSLDGISLDGPEAPRRAVRDLEVGDRVKLTLFRAGNENAISYRLPERRLLPSDIPG